MSDEIKRVDVLRQLGAIAMGRCNDAVKLAYLDPDATGLSSIDGLDLTMVTEFKRAGNGGVEIKLLDRLEAISLLLEHVDREGLRPEAVSFLRAMDRAAEVSGRGDS